MNCSEAARAGFLIVSGAVEAVNKVLFKARMKRSMQSWSRKGGQEVFTFRSLIKSDRFDRAWEILKLKCDEAVNGNLLNVLTKTNTLKVSP